MALTEVERDLTDFTSSDGVVDEERFAADIIASSITVEFDVARGVQVNDDNDQKCRVWFDDPLTGGDLTIYNGLVADHDGTPLPQTMRVGGGLIIEDLDDPSAPTVAAQGTTGSTTWGYKVTAWSDTGETLASSETQITDGNATLDGTNFNRVSWTEVEGAVEYSVYRHTAGGTPSSTGLLATTTLLTLDDIGGAASGSDPGEDLSGALVVGTGDVPVGKLVTIKELTSDDSTVTSLLRIARCSSGTPEAGFGSGHYFQLDDATNVLRAVGATHLLWSDADAADLEADFRVMLRDGVSATLVERLRVTHDGRLELSENEVLGIGTCRIGFPLDAGVKGGNASISSNNTVASVTFDNLAESRIRWNIRPPQNYTSGDLTFRMLCSVAGSPGSNSMRLELRWSNLSDSDTLPGSYQNSEAQTKGLSGVSNDKLFTVDFTIGSGDFDSTADMMAMYLRRDGDHAGDTTSLTLHIHLCELRYTGHKLAGQAGQ